MCSRRLSILVVSLAAMLGSPAAGQAQTTTPPAGQQPATTFRSTVDVVAVDVNVLDRTGRPVDDLKVGEFSLKVDGKPRRLASAEFVSLRKVDDDPELTSKVYSTTGRRAPGRLIMFIIDESNIHKGGGKSAFKAAAKFIDTLNPADRVALQVMPGSGPIVDFTANHLLVKTMLERAVGQAVEADRTGHVGVAEAMAIVEQDDADAINRVVDRECHERDASGSAACRSRLLGEANSMYTRARFRTINALTTLRSILDRLAMTAEPKTVIYISEGLVLDRTFADLSWVAPLLMTAQVNLYGLRLSGQLYDAAMGRVSPTREDDQDLMIEGMNQLIGHGRGTVFSVAVSADPVFTRLGLELSGYYLLTFEPDLKDRDGKMHDISVGVSRRGATVRARREFSAEPLGAVKTTDQLLTDTMRSSLLGSDFGLKATTFAYRDDESGRIKVIIGAEIDRSVNPSAPFAVAYSISDSQGVMTLANVDKNVAVPAGQAGRPQYFMNAVVLDPGVYRLKIAAVDPKGQRSSVEHTFDAKLTAIGQLRLGALMLARPDSGPARVRPTVDGKIDTNSVLAYVEVYSDAEPQLQAATLTIEVAAHEDGRTLESGPMPFADRKIAGKRVAQATVPLGLLAAGNYVARVVLTVGGQPIGRVTRPFTLTHAAGAAPPRPLAASAPVAPILFSSRIDTFDRAAVLSRPVLAFFLDRMTVVGLPPMPAALAPAVGYARSGRFAELQNVVHEAATDHLATPFLDGLARLGQGDVNGAVVSLQQALARAPGYLPAAFYLGASYAASGRDREAVTTWKAGLVTDRSAPWIYTVLADALVRLREPAQALDILTEAARIWPDNDDVTMRLGTVLSLTGQPGPALKMLDPYLARHADDGERLMLAMRLIYEARVAGRPLENVDSDRAHFVRYFEAYRKTNGADLAKAEEWKRLVDRG